jgi:hypothetical protein
MASEDSGQGGRNRLLAALTSEDHCLLASHLKVMSCRVANLAKDRDWTLGKTIQKLVIAALDAKLLK